MLKSQRWFFSLCAIEGAAAIAVLLAIPSEGGNLSPARLAVIGFIAALCLGWIGLALRAPQALNRFSRPVYLYTCVLVSLFLCLLIFLLRYLDPESLHSIYQRLSPVLWYLLVLSLQLSLFFLLSLRGIHFDKLSERRPIWVSSLSALATLLVIFLFISLTRIGLKPDAAYWSEPGVPLLGWQLALAWLGGGFVLIVAFSGRERLLDRLLPVVIYLVAVTVWLSVPADVLAHSFYMPMSPPTFEPFPYSDAGYYDQMAHSLLIGHPYQGQIPTRPLYIVLLTGLHLLFGENYRQIVAGQTVVLAVIPVLFYFLGRKLHSRAAGVMAALFFIFRELTSLLVTSETRVSNTKMLLVDLPTLLLLVLACLLAMRWLEQKDWKSALLAGGTFGLLLMLRTQSALVLGCILLAALLVLGWKKKPLYLLTAFFFLGLLVTVIPWLLHNYLRTGELAFDAQFQYKTIASQYAYTGNLDISEVDFQGKGLGQILIEFTLKDPGFVLGFIASHFLAAQVDGLLALPLLKPYHGIFQPINLYWMSWDGRLEWYNVLLLVLYLGVIAIGLGSAWRRWRWVGLLPLGFSLSYTLATAIGRFSGWRYDLPADWVWYFYFAIGSAELFVQAALLFNYRGERNDAQPPEADRTAAYRPGAGDWPRLFLFCSLFALLGGLPWLAEKIASPHYPDQSPDLLEQKIMSLPKAPALAELQSFAAQPDAFIQTGRVIYPRFFSKNGGIISTTPWPAYALRDYPRIGFLFLNDSSTSVVFPTKKIAEFPRAADAILLGCRRERYIEARLIALPELGILYSGAPLTEPCSP